MDFGLGIAGLICLLLAAGHAAVGRQIIPALNRDQMPSTFFGRPSTTWGMLRFTWHVVTVWLLAFAALLMLMASSAVGDDRALVLHWIAVVWLAVVVTVFWVGRRGVRHLLRLPMPYLFAAIALLAWLSAI